MVARVLLVMWFLVCLAACHQTIDPCPEGYRAERVQNRCVAQIAADAASVLSGEGEPDGVTPEIPDGVDPDAADAEPGVDANGDGIETEARDAGAAEPSLDAGGSNGPGDAASVGVDMDAALDADGLAAEASAEVEAGADSDASDSGDPDADAGPEGGTDASLDTGAPDTGAPVCSTSDLAAWRAQHLADGMRNVITNCGMGCDGGYACVDQCLRQAAGMQGCSDCTQAETACGGQWCSYACLPSRTDRLCLSCLCQADCLKTFTDCAAQDLALCQPSLFGPDPVVDAPALSTAALLIGKSNSGSLSSARFDQNTGLLGADTTITSFPAGAARLVALSLASRELAFHYNASCAVPPCTVRAYPVLDAGTFGAPVFEERWDADFVDLETFSSGGVGYLVRLHGNTSDAAAESLWIDRLDWSDEQAKVLRSPSLRSQQRSATQATFSQVEAFALGAEVFLFLGTPATGEVRIVRADATPSGVELVNVGEFVWSLGWDQVEAFKSADRWYVLAYKSGSTDVSNEPAGQLRIWQPALDADGRVTLGGPVLDVLRAQGLARTLSYTDQNGQAHFLLHNITFGQLDIYALDPDPTHWPDSFAKPLQSQKRNATWDIFDLVRQGQW